MLKFHKLDKNMDTSIDLCGQNGAGKGSHGAAPH